MYEWLPVSILAFLVALGFGGEALEAGRLRTLREELAEPPSLPGLAW